jgi:aminoglycoside 3-N-acetyltransferase
VTQLLGPGEVIHAFERCGIRSGDVVMVHSDALVAAQFPPMSAAARYDLLIDALLTLLGRDGTLVMPTFTYSFSRGETFDVRQSPSTVGAITEHFRHRSGVRRSLNPMFSVAAYGRHADEFAMADPSDCFGEQSAFAQLHVRDGKIVCIGCAFDRITFIHYVEQQIGVDYRYFKAFEGCVIDADCMMRTATVRCFVRDLDRNVITDLSPLRIRMSRNGNLTVGELGRVEMTAVRARDFHDDARALLAEGADALIREEKVST